jgi:hypothetical protein
MKARISALLIKINDLENGKSLLEKKLVEKEKKSIEKVSNT